MSHAYQGVGWNAQKKKYDFWILSFVFIYLGVFAGVTLWAQPFITIETLIIRAFGSLSFVLLSTLLLIGPLARLDVRFLPVLYNRRHLGVATFLIAAVHGSLALFQFHLQGELNPLVSVFVSDGAFTGDGPMYFQPFGALALIILFVMASTSHDFWLANLGPSVWKSFHMSVYVAYTALLAHVTLGALQSEGKTYLWVMLASAAASVFTLHLWAGVRERSSDRPAPLVERAGYVRVARTDQIPEGRGRAVSIGPERVAVFKNGDTISCVSNVCRHQMGPIGDGKIIDGCITCPWHGYQYDPVTGCSPPPFTERLETHDVILDEGFVWVNPIANELGTSAKVAVIESGQAQ